MKKADNKPEENYDDIIKATQEQAIKAIHEQAQAMSRTFRDSRCPVWKTCKPKSKPKCKRVSLIWIRYKLHKPQLGAPGGMPAGTTIPENAFQQNMALANDFAQAMKGYEGNDMLDSDWEIERADDGKLDDTQLRLLAFGAPLLVYNSEQVDSYESEYDIDTIKNQMNDWWGIKNRKNTWEIVHWLLEEGHHAEADEALRILHEKGIEAFTGQQPKGKMKDVLLIRNLMLQQGYCNAQEIPATAIAWDLVRVVNVGRWTYLCGYISFDEMWQIMETAEQEALRHFSSWEEYGRSFVMGRGVWHGDPEDCTTAQEIIETLLGKDESPWKQIPWRG